jgi:hypothetical protein
VPAITLQLLRKTPSDENGHSTSDRTGLDSE